MIQVVLLYENGREKEVILAVVPRIGEQIRVPNGPESPDLVVKRVLHIAGVGDDPPRVVVSVRGRDA